MNARTAILTLALLASAAPLACQPAARTSGFALGLSAAGTTVRSDDTDNESGAGLGLRLGYGFRDRFLAFAEAGVASVASSEVEGDYGLSHLDLGLRYRFGAPQRRVAPYAEAAFSSRMATYDFDDEGTLDVAGGGLTLGGGVEYAMGASLSLDAGLRLTQGRFNRMRVDEGDWQEVGEGTSATSMRLSVGVLWRP